MATDLPHTLPFNPGMGNSVSGISVRESDEPIEVNLEDDEVPKGKLDSMVINHPDGSVTINFEKPKSASISPLEHFDNIAEKIDIFERNKIAEELLTLIAEDNSSRADWLTMRAESIKLLGLKVEKPGTADASAPIQGQSTVRHPLLLQAVISFQSNAQAELLPSSGPVKIRNDGRGDKATLQEAEDLEKDMNHYLTVVDKSYYPDTDRLLFSVGLDGCGFKKLYHCPLKERPASVSIYAEDLIISNAAADIGNAARVTHQIKMRRSVFKRMQLVGAYLSDDVINQSPQPSEQQNPVTAAKANIQGIAQREVLLINPEEGERLIYECSCEFDLPGFEHKRKGEVTGLPLPWKITIDVTSRKILAIQRNWNKDDELYEARKEYVKYPFIPYTGFYEIGYGHILGNTTLALTAAWREMLDAGMFANFPGTLHSKEIGSRQLTNEFRVGPGQSVPVQTNGRPIGDVIMALPYKDITPGLLSFVDKMAMEGKELAGTAAQQVGEGKQDAPVGTTIALIEQATKVIAAVHKRLHGAQAEEFQILKQLFREDPESLWKFSKTAGSRKWNEESLRRALENQDLVPAADPNTPSHMHRIMKCVALKQIAMSQPQLYNMKEVDDRILKVMGWDDVEGLFAPPAPAPNGPPPELAAIMAQVALKEGDQKIAAQKNAISIAGLKQKDAKDKADRELKENLSILDVAKTLAVHPEAMGLIDEAIGSMESVNLTGASS